MSDHIPTAEEIRDKWGDPSEVYPESAAFLAELVERSAERFERAAQSVRDKAAVEQRDSLASEARVINAYEAKGHALRDYLAELKPVVAAGEAAEQKRQENPMSKADTPPTFTRNMYVARYRGDSPEVEEVRTLMAGQSTHLEWDMGQAWQERALAQATEAAGGATVPTRLLNRIIDRMIFREPLLDVLQVESVNHYGPIDIPYLVSAGTAGYVAEAGDIASSSTDPSFATMSIPAAKAAILLKASRELIDSDAVNIENFLVRDMSRSLATQVGTWLCNGTAEPQPEGLFWAASTAVNGTAGDYGPETDEVINLHYSLAPEWRADSVFVAADDAVQKLRLEKDANGRYIMQFDNGLAGPAPARLLGRPVYATSNVSIGSAVASMIAFSPEATLFRVGPLRVETSRDAYFGTDEIGFRASWSVGHRVVQSDGVKAYAGTAA